MELTTLEQGLPTMLAIMALYSNALSRHNSGSHQANRPSYKPRFWEHLRPLDRLEEKGFVRMPKPAAVGLTRWPAKNYSL